MWQMDRSCFLEHVEHSDPRYAGQTDVPPGFIRPACLHAAMWLQTGRAWSWISLQLFIWLSISYWRDIAHNINLLNDIQCLFDAFQKLREVFLNSHNEADMQEPCVSSQQGAMVLLGEADVLSQYFSHVPPITKCFGWDAVIFLLEEGDLVLDRPGAAVFPKYNSTPKVSGRLTRVRM